MRLKRNRHRFLIRTSGLADGFIRLGEAEGINRLAFQAFIDAIAPGPGETDGLLWQRRRRLPPPA